MAKNVFRSNEVKLTQEKISISPPPELKQFKPREEEKVPQEEEYSGPTVEELRQEAEEFRQNWEKEKEEMINSAKAEADNIIQEAENSAFEEIRKGKEEASETKRKAQEEADSILEDAKKQSEQIVSEAQQTADDLVRNAKENGFREGKEQGFQEGSAEVERLIDRLHIIINKAIEKRNEIIEETEAQIVHLVLQIVKKVVKVISENQRNIVINNVIQALRKLKSKGDVVIRVNIDDLGLTTEHTKKFMQHAERAKNITVMEDSTVDRGGCIIETDFGQIDARISSQLKEIEDRILELVPIKGRRKSEY